MDRWSTDTGSMDTDREPLLTERTGGVNILPGPLWPTRSRGEESEESEEGEEVREVAEVETKLYPQRWYIALLFAIISFTQGCIWNTWGPISNSSEKVFNWTDADIALLSNWGPIAYIVSAPQFAWLMDVQGLRWASLVTMFLVATGAGLRCITSTNPAATWLIHLGHLLNGLGGPVAMAGGPVLSAVWFPAHQRTTATAFIVGFNMLGLAVSFIIGPLLVPERGNTTLPHNISLDLDAITSNIVDVDQTRHDIMRLMYIEFGVAAVIFLLTLIYFPSRPKKPPTTTASIQRTDFKSGLKKIFRHKAFWLLAAPYALSGGIYAGWTSVMDLILDKKGISQDTAGWLGFFSTIAGSIAGLFIARFADIFKKRMKLYMILLFTGATVSFTVFTIAYIGLIPITIGLLYGTLLPGALFISAAAPLFYELCCETSYPIAEGLTNTLLTWLNNIVGLIFLFILMIPNLGDEWMNWVIAGCSAACIPMLCMVKERYSRLDIDTLSETSPVNSAQGTAT